MLRYRWPGNVRELKNVIERAVVLCPRRVHRPGRPAAVEPRHGRRHRRVRHPAQSELRAHARWPTWSSSHILATLNHTGWNKSQAAGILGIERSTLDRKIRRYDLIEQRTAGG